MKKTIAVANPETKVDQELLDKVSNENLVLKEMLNLEDNKYYRLQVVRLNEQLVQQSMRQAEALEGIRTDLQVLLSEGEEDDGTEEPLV